MTGRYPMRHGLQVGVVRPWAQYGLPLEERTLPQALKEAGYTTAIIGKWHLGHFRPEYLPTSRGFDHQYGHYNGALDYFTHIRDGGFDWHKDDKVCRDEGYTTHLIAKEAVEFVAETPARSRSSCTCRSTRSTPRTRCRTSTEAIPEPEGRAEEVRRDARSDGRGRRADRGCGGEGGRAQEHALRLQQRQRRSATRARNRQRQVPRGQSHTLRRRRSRRGVRRVGWPHQGRQHVTEPMHMVDWYPTLLKLAGAKAEQKLPLDGLDIWPTLTQGKPSPHEAILLNTTPTSGAVRAGDWKLVVKNGEDDFDAREPARKRGQEMARSPSSCST